jgi:hypothetical protein
MRARAMMAGYSVRYRNEIDAPGRVESGGPERADGAGTPEFLRAAGPVTGRATGLLGPHRSGWPFALGTRQAGWQGQRFRQLRH